MKNIHIIFGSSRKGRNGEVVSRWVEQQLKAMSIKDVTFELIDLRELNLPMFDAAKPPLMGEYEEPYTQQWAAKIAAADGFLIITPEYNHGYPAVLKNALDHLYAEWNYKPVSFVSYGATSGGIRAVEQLRQVAVELRMMPLKEEVNIPLIWQAFTEQGQPQDEALNARLEATITHLVEWTGKLKQVR